MAVVVVVGVGVAVAVVVVVGVGMNLRELFNLLRRPVLGPFEPIRRPEYSPNERLIARQIEAAKRCPVNGIRPIVGTPEHV